MRNKLIIIALIFSLMLLAACGGSSASEPEVESPAASEEDTGIQEEAAAEEPADEAAAAEEEPTVEAAAEEPADEVEPAVEEESEESAAEEAAAEEPADEEGITGFGDLPMSGIDPETGLEINPDMVNPGDTFIARGIVISMNLTPVTEPEFLIQAPSGTKYRVRTQALVDMYFIDGSQWQAFEFRQGVGATATITLDASASQSDVANTKDLMLIMTE